MPNSLHYSKIKNGKLIVFDLDGTLLTSDYVLTQQTIEAVERIRNLGLRVTIATGRSYKSAKPFLDRLNIDEPMVFGNGSVYDNPSSGEREVICGIPLETALITLMLSDQFQVSLKIHTANGTIYKSNNTPWPDEGIHFEVGTIVDNLKAELSEDPIKIVFFADPEEHKKFQVKLKEVLAGKSPVSTFNTHPLYVEMINRNVSKGKTVLKLVKQLGIKPENVITVGDQENDYEMLRDLGIGVMVGSSAPKLQAVCDHQIPEPENNGIAVLADWLKSAR